MDEIILNASINVISIEMHVDVLTGKKDEYLCLEIVFSDADEVKKFNCPYSKLRSKEFFNKLEEEGVIFSELGVNRKKLKTEILKQRRTASIFEKLICPQGFFEYGADHVCKLGNEIFSRGDTILNCVSDIEELHLRHSTEGAYKEALEFAFVDEMAAPMLLMYIGFSMWNDFFAEATHPQRFVLYIEGETGSMKSSLCREVINIFDEKIEMSLSSTYAALQMLFQNYRAVPVLLDDFNESEFKKIKKEKGEKLVELIQMYADREELCKINNKKVICLSIQSGLIVTAESPLQNFSTINRCLVATPTNLDIDKLTEIQHANSDDAIFADLLRNMAKYTIEKYEKIQKKIPNIYNTICKKTRGFDEYRKVPGYSRVMESYRISYMVLYLWEDFLNYKKEETGMVKELMECMSDSLENATEYTLSLLRPEDNNWNITVAVCNGIQHRIEKGEIIDEKKKFKQNPNKYLGLIKDKSIYIRGDDLFMIVSEELCREVSKKEISNALFKNGLIHSGSNGRYSMAIPGSNSNNRYYCLDRRVFNEIYEQENPHTFSLFSYF